MKKELAALAVLLTLTGCNMEPEVACKERLQLGSHHDTPVLTEVCIDAKVKTGLMFNEPIETVRQNIKYCSEMAWLEYTDFVFESGCSEPIKLNRRMRHPIWKARVMAIVQIMGEKRLKNYDKNKKRIKTRLNKIRNKGN